MCGLILVWISNVNYYFSLRSRFDVVQERKLLTLSLSVSLRFTCVLEKKMEVKRSVCEDETEDVKWVKHYSSMHEILLVGEGDFSFSLSLANAFGSAINIIATSHDSYGVLSFHPSLLTRTRLNYLDCINLPSMSFPCLGRFCVVARLCVSWRVCWKDFTISFQRSFLLKLNHWLIKSWWDFDFLQKRVSIIPFQGFFSWTWLYKANASFWRPFPLLYLFLF